VSYTLVNKIMTVVNNNNLQRHTVDIIYVSVGTETCLLREAGLSPLPPPK
jgi:hypothetical protein